MLPPPVRAGERGPGTRVRPADAFGGDAWRAKRSAGPAEIDSLSRPVTVVTSAPIDAGTEMPRTGAYPVTGPPADRLYAWMDVPSAEPTLGAVPVRAT